MTPPPWCQNWLRPIRSHQGWKWERLKSLLRLKFGHSRSLQAKNSENKIGQILNLKWNSQTLFEPDYALLQILEIIAKDRRLWTCTKIFPLTWYLIRFISIFWAYKSKPENFIRSVLKCFVGSWNTPKTVLDVLMTPKMTFSSPIHRKKSKLRYLHFNWIYISFR